MKYTMKYLIDFIALVLLYAFFFFRKWKSKGKDILLIDTLMYVYLCFVLYFTLMPVITSLPFILNHPYKPINTVPFVDVLAGRGDFMRQILLNVIMMLPFGFLFPMTQNPAVGFCRTIFFCFLICLSIELLQPFFNRSADVTDLITNIIGGMAGYVLYIIFRPITSRVLGRN